MLLTVLTLLTLTSPNNKEDKFLSLKVKLKSLSNSLSTRITKSISISLNTEPSRAISKKISDNSSSTTMTLERDSTNWNTPRISKLKNSALRSALLTATIKKDLRNSKLKSTILKTNSRELKKTYKLRLKKPTAIKFIETCLKLKIRNSIPKLKAWIITWLC